jgi:hypothetical protein
MERVGDRATMQGCVRAVTSDAGLFRLVIMGILLIDDQQRACVVQIEQTAQRTVALEARRLSPRPMPGTEPPSLRLSAPDTMLVNNVFRLAAEFVTDWNVALGHDASEANSLRIDAMPPLRRPIEFNWSSDCPVERWLRALQRATTRCPLMRPLFGD